MGRAIALLAFLAFFLVFALFKSIAGGAKAAYTAVFDKPDLTEHESLTFAGAFTIIDFELKKSYDLSRHNLAEVLLSVIPKVRDWMTGRGYNMTLCEARELVLQAIPRVHVHVPQEQLAAATTNLKNRI